MLQNAYFLAKIGADTAENEQHFAEILPKTGNYPMGAAGAGDVRTVGRPGPRARPRACVRRSPPGDKGAALREPSVDEL